MGNSSNRRHFLKAASGMLAAPLLMNGRTASAQTKAPLRFLTILDTYGVPVENRSNLWIGSRSGDYALEQSSLGSILQPLSGHLDKLLVFSNADFRKNGSAFSVFHHGSVYALTPSRATGNKPNNKQQHASLDYVIGDHLSGDYGLQHPRAHAHLYLSDVAQPDKISASFGQGGVPIRSIAGHENITRALFAADAGPADDGLADRLLLDSSSRGLVLDMVGSRVRELKPQLVSANASQVLDAYETSVGELATQLEGAVGFECTAPDFGGMNPQDGRRTALTTDTIYHAFACDMASSVLYTIGGEVENFMKHDFLFNAGEHSGATRDYLGKSLHASSHGNSADELKVQELVRIYQSGLIKDLVDRMSVTPDVDGSMMIDNTVIYIASSLSNNTHIWGDFCLAAIAGKNTNLKPGFHYDLSGLTNNDILTTLAQGVTVPIDSFGGFDGSGQLVGGLNSGPISKMLKQVHS